MERSLSIMMDDYIPAEQKLYIVCFRPEFSRLTGEERNI